MTMRLMLVQRIDENVEDVMDDSLIEGRTDEGWGSTQRSEKSKIDSSIDFNFDSL